MEYFGPDAFRPRRRRRVMAALSVLAVLGAALLTAFAVDDRPAASASASASPSPVVVHDLVPPDSAGGEPLDGGSPPSVVEDPEDGPPLTETVSPTGEGETVEAPGPDPTAGPDPAPETSRGNQRPSPDAGDTYRPVDGYVVTARYGQPGSWAAGHHTGVDLAVPVGTEVVAARGGTVVCAAYDKAYGNFVLLYQSDGLYALYAHLSKITVRMGRTVRAGDQLGLSGASGRVTGPHLHFEMRSAPGYGSDIDPVAYLRSHRIVL
ncbi:peptidoglycan DD-metalloendopeptidase family protein [Streptomyces sp. NPDC000618]|uniref:M23 family metallopeptidase n=1 Tax=Streptomyces sp. NPDC000618 TaxID=3154265 RepID=UPI0033219C1F